MKVIIFSLFSDLSIYINCLLAYSIFLCVLFENIFKILSPNNFLQSETMTSLHCVQRLIDSSLLV